MLPPRVVSASLLPPSYSLQRSLPSSRRPAVARSRWRLRTRPAGAPCDDSCWAKAIGSFAATELESPRADRRQSQSNRETPDGSEVRCRRTQERGCCLGLVLASERRTRERIGRDVWAGHSTSLQFEDPSDQLDVVAPDVVAPFLQRLALFCVVELDLAGVVAVEPQVVVIPKQ